MPLIDANQAASWGEDFYTGGYARARKAAILGSNGLAFGEGDHFKLKAALGLTPAMKIAVIGGGFGWLAEDWIAAGLDCYVTDTSTWIQSNKGVQATLPILNETALTLQSRRNILQAAGLPNNGRFTFAITEDVLPFLTNNEATQLSSGLRNFADTVAHWVSVGTASSNPAMNNKTAAQWKTLINPDLIVPRGTGTVL